jgi:MFS family permease
MGVAMAATLYEPVFVVVTKPWRERRDRALTAITLMGGLASFVFLPLAQALIDALGWRSALLVLAAILGVTAVPLNVLARRGGDPDRSSRRPRGAGCAAGRTRAARARLLAAGARARRAWRRRSGA